MQTDCLECEVQQFVVRSPRERPMLCVKPVKIRSAIFYSSGLEEYCKNIWDEMFSNQSDLELTTSEDTNNELRVKFQMRQSQNFP